MNALTIGGIVFLCVFGGALSGMYLSGALPKHHLSAESKDIIRLSIAMIATLSALVLGLLVASAKGSFDSKNTELTKAAAESVLLDRTLAEYGPAAQKSRDLLRQIIISDINRIWPNGAAGEVQSQAAGQGAGLEVIDRDLLELAPQNDSQRWLKSRALQINGDIAETRWLIIEQVGSSVQWPLLAILVFWLTVTFVSFGVFAPRYGSVIVALLVSAISVAASIYLIVNLDQPYNGLIKLSSAPLVTSLKELSQQ
jgi:hypothetical protein